MLSFAWRCGAFSCTIYTSQEIWPGIAGTATNGAVQRCRAIIFVARTSGPAFSGFAVPTGPAAGGADDAEGGRNYADVPV
jgi:hypothetical protein